MAIKICEESVVALKKLATDLPEAIEGLEQAKQDLESSFEEKKQFLGPHTDKIQEIIEKVSEIQSEGQDSVLEVQSQLLSAALAIKDILDSGINVNP